MRRQTRNTTVGPACQRQRELVRLPCASCLRVLCALFLVSWFAGCASFEQHQAQAQHVRQLNEDGVYLFQQGDYARARESFERAAELKPGDAGLAFNIGQCHDRQGHSGKAEEAYRTCLEKDPNHAAGRDALTRLLMFQGRRSEAEETVKTWLVAQPKAADAYATEAWLARQDGDLQRTQALLQQSLKLDPHNVRALTELGLLYEFVLERPDRALVLYEQALAEAPGRADLRDNVNRLRARGVKGPMLDN